MLQKIAGLIESKYVLADKAKGYADEFRAKCASGAYDAFTEAKEFAEKVNADLVAIMHDKHLNFRVIVPSDVGEKAEGSLHHPIRYFRLRTKENVEFYISTERTISPVTGGNWEGTGVIPDLPVPATAALDAAVVEAKKAAGLISEFFIDVFAYNFQSAQDEQMLFAILAKSIEFFPDSPTAFERLAYVHDSRGNKELALRYFQKVPALDPDNRNAAKMIQEIQNRK